MIGRVVKAAIGAFEELAHFLGLPARTIVLSYLLKIILHSLKYVNGPFWLMTLLKLDLFV